MVYVSQKTKPLIDIKERKRKKSKYTATKISTNHKTKTGRNKTAKQKTIAMKTQLNGKQSCVLEPEELMLLKCLYYSKR